MIVLGEESVESGQACKITIAAAAYRRPFACVLRGSQKRLL